MAAQAEFEEQLAKALLHSSLSWQREFEIAKALKIAQQDENIDDEAIGLEMIGDIYVKRGLEDDSLELFERLDELVLSTALYNSSLVRTTHSTKRSELNIKLRQVEEDFLKLCGLTINKNDFKYDVDSNHKEKLEKFRQCCREKLNDIQATFTVFVSPLHDTDVESEMRRAGKIEELFMEIKEFTKQFVAILLDECVDILGPAPEDVGYAFVGFGSFARSETTPYSDIESAIFIEEGKDSADVKEYFVKLTEYFNLKVLNLQETILPSMCIPSLNDKNQTMDSLKRYKCTCTTCTNPGEVPTSSRDGPTTSRDGPTASRDARTDWFYDNEMRGVCVDGRMKNACKSPLGLLVQRRRQCEGKDGENLIKTPTDMANLYVSSLLADSRTPGHKNNDYSLSTVLANVSFLYGNDEDLVDSYNAIVFSMSEITEGDTKFNARQTSAIGCLRNALEVFEFSLNASDIGLISSVKQKLYRVVDMLTMNLGKLQYSTVVDNSPWNVLERFLEMGVISAQAYHNLKVIVGIVNEVRLTTYLRCGRQDEVFSFFDQSTDIDTELAKNFFVRFFYTVFPFQRSIKVFLSRVSDHSSLVQLLFSPEENFYEYSHFKSAIALSFTSHGYFDQTMWRFSEAFADASDESTRRLCLAFLSCLHPDYSTRYCQKILASTENESSLDWKIFSFLIGSLASFHQDDVEKVKAFLQAANDELSHRRSTPHRHSTPGLASEVVVQSYEILIRGLLNFREKRYLEAIRDFDEARSKYMTRLNEDPEESRINKLSIFILCCVFMKGRSHLELGNVNDSSIEMAMRAARAYTANGHYMRILYHAYIGVVSLDGADENEVAPKHIEKVLELFLRFQCPIGQELWVSIAVQGVILATLFLGMLYRESNRTEDALRIFQLASSSLIPKALKFCEKKYHVGTKSVETFTMCVDAFKAVFKLLEAECLHASNRHDEMWTCLGEALAQLAKYRGKFQPIDLQDVVSASTSRQSAQVERESEPVWQTPIDSVPPAPRLIDNNYTMAPTLKAWCDNLTMAMQYILYSMERDVYSMVLEKGTPIILLIAMMSSNFTLPEEFQSNPYDVLNRFIPLLRHDATAAQMIGNIFNVANYQRKSVFELIKKNVVECQHYATEFTEQWIEVMLLFLRMSLCHDLVSASGILK